jgi:glycosyltransferase involved in cell wall biosynthesis
MLAKQANPFTQTNPLIEPAQPGSESKVLTIIIPAFNEELGIEYTLRSLCENETLAEAEIIVVDDGSRDKTCEIVRHFPQVKLVQHPFNRGYGSAIRTGARASKGKYIVWFDSDGQHRVEDLLAVADRLVSGRLEYCIGVRGSDSFEENNRKLGKWMLRQVVRFAAGRSVPDFNSGLRGFKREILLQYLHLLPKGFGASTLTTLLMVEGSHYGETVPITVNQRMGKSTVKQIRDGLRTLQIILHIVLLFKPMQFFGGLGALFILTGGIYGVAKALMIGLGFPVLASLLIILGVEAFFFGFLCDQISALRRERFNEPVDRTGR